MKAVTLFEIECNSFLFFIMYYNIPKKIIKEAFAIRYYIKIFIFQFS